jgi:hypothetical protein
VKKVLDAISDLGIHDCDGNSCVFANGAPDLVSIKQHTERYTVVRAFI